MDENEILSLSLKHNLWTWAAQAHVHPIPVKTSKGVYFWDTNGKKYLDFNSMVMCSNIGHGNEKVIKAICDQAQELTFAGPRMATRPRAELGKVLSEVTPGNLNKFLYTLGGADANENAIKIARAYTGKTKILTRYRSYHGATLGAMALTGDPRRWAWEPLTTSGVVHFLDPYRYRSTFHRHNISISDAHFCSDYLNHVEEIIQYEGPDSIAAILIESITGTNGIIIPPDGYLQGIRKLCDRYDILMIADEVMSGFGRTGKWFAVNHWDVIPDIITMAKGLTSGYAPLGAVGIKNEIADSFNEKVFYGGMTYNGHPLCLSAAIANIQVLQEENLIVKSAERGIELSDALAKLQEKHRSVGEVRSIGLFSAIELVKDRFSRHPLAEFNQTSEAMQHVLKHLMDRGVFLYSHWNLLLIIPPLIISSDELHHGLSIVDEALDIADQYYIS